MNMQSVYKFITITTATTVTTIIIITTNLTIAAVTAITITAITTVTTSTITPSTANPLRMIMDLALHALQPTSDGFLNQNGHTIRTPDDITTYVAALGLSEVQEQTFRLQCARHFARVAAAMNEIADPMILQYHHHSQASGDEDYIEAGSDIRDDIETAQKRGEERAKRQASLVKAFQKAIEMDRLWDGYRSHPYVVHIESHGANTLRAFAALVTAAQESQRTPDHVILNISHYILWRLTVELKHASPGPSLTRFDLLALIGLFRNQPEPRTTVDAHGSHFQLSSLAITRAELQAAEAARRNAKSPVNTCLRIGHHNEVLEFDRPSEAPDYPTDRIAQEEPAGEEARGDGIVLEEPGGEEQPGRPLPAKSPPKRRRSTPSPSPDDSAADLFLAQLGRTGVAHKRRRKQAIGQIDGWKRRCNCHRFGERAISQEVRIAIEDLDDVAAYGTDGDGAEIRRKAAIAVAHSIDGRRVCHSHCFIFAAKTGIYKASVPHPLLERIIARYGQQDSGYLSSDEAAQLIKKAYRDPHPLDDAGLAQMSPHPTADSPLLHLAQADSERLLDEIFPGMRQAWHTDGDVVSDIFGWIFTDREACEMIEYELDMYDYHLRLPPGQSRMGWLRNANFTQIQQLIRMDLLFYAEHVLLHEEHPVRLISYPYEMKLAVIGVNTAFSHLDLNVHRVIEDLDGVKEYAVRKYIQSAVSLTPEDRRNCTKIIPGMHQDHVFREWAHDQPANTQAVNASVAFTEEHARRFGTRFRYDVANAGEARISDPRLLHGTDGPATRRRAAAFAWLVQHDGTNLAQPGTGSVQELGEAHRDRLLGKHLNSPSGYPNKAGMPLTPFPASMQLLSSSALSNAILGRACYTDPSVQRELQILFGTDAEARRRLIDSNRREMLRKAKENWQHQQEIERAHFGENSFFTNRDVFRQTDHIQRHARPTFAEEIQLERQQGKKGRPNHGTEELIAEDLESEQDSGEEMAAEITASDGDVLQEEQKVHPAVSYRRLGVL